MLQKYTFSHFNAEDLKAIQVLSDVDLSITSNRLKVATNLTGAGTELSAILPMLHPAASQYIMTIRDLAVSLTGASRVGIGFFSNTKYGIMVVGMGFDNDGTNRVRTFYASFYSGGALGFTWLGNYITLDTSLPITIMLTPIKTAETAGYTTPTVAYDITILHNSTRETTTISASGIKPYNVAFICPGFVGNYISSDADYVAFKSMEISTDMNYQLADI